MCRYFDFYFDVLSSDRSVIIPEDYVRPFYKYAIARGVYPCGGAILEDGFRVLYLN